LPITKESQEEAKRQALSTKMLINPSNMKIITIPSQEMILGLYLLSTATKGKYGEKCIYKKEEMTYGMSIINKCFPNNYPIVNETINTKTISDIIYDIFNKYPNEIVQVLDKIKFTGFKYATLIGHTISLKGMNSNEKIKNEIYKKENKRDQLDEITSEKVKKYLQEHFVYTDMIESGARGSWDQARQLILTRGFVSNFNGNILPTPIKNCLIEGLTPKEFFLSSYGCRKGLLDIALKTASSGYLFRKFLFACSNLMLDYNNEDCGTTDLLGVYISDIKKAYSVKGRWYAPDVSKPSDLILITDNNLNDILNKKIFIRSPIFCKTKKLCKKCYGELYKYLNNSRFVGSIAAQSLGESNTQMVLRTFHTSGVAITKKSNKEQIQNNRKNDKMKQEDIVGALSLISHLVHKFDIDLNCESLVEKLHHIYSDGRFFLLIHFECLVSQLMWYERKKWRLLENRQNIPYKFQSIVSVPSLESWLMGLAFSNTKRELINGLLEPGLYSGGVIDKILCGISYKNI
jgi:DNA-directed RNA polymerase subunit beta'